MKELKIKHIWLVILYVWYSTFTSTKVVLPKDIKEDEITLAIGIIAFILISIILLIISIIYIIF